MITFHLFLIVLITHWLADFVLQTHWQATNKGKNNVALSLHVFTYTLCWIFPIFFLAGAWTATLFCLITFTAHWITDFFTSRLNGYLWLKGDVHNFFVSVGFDQVLHYVQLFLTFYLLTTKF